MPVLGASFDSTRGVYPRSEIQEQKGAEKGYVRSMYGVLLSGGMERERQRERGVFVPGEATLVVLSWRRQRSQWLSGLDGRRPRQLLCRRDGYNVGS